MGGQIANMCLLGARWFSVGMDAHLSTVLTLLANHEQMQIMIPRPGGRMLVPDGKTTARRFINLRLRMIHCV